MRELTFFESQSIGGGSFLASLSASARGFCRAVNCRGYANAMGSGAVLGGLGGMMVGGIGAGPGALGGALLGGIGFGVHQLIEGPAPAPAPCP